MVKLKEGSVFKRKIKVYNNYYIKLLNKAMEENKHMCYILHNTQNNATYNGYSIDFLRRLRQHNGLIKGGAKVYDQVCAARHYLGTTHTHYVISV